MRVGLFELMHDGLASARRPTGVLPDPIPAVGR